MLLPAVRQKFEGGTVKVRQLSEAVAGTSKNVQLPAPGAQATTVGGGQDRVGALQSPTVRVPPHVADSVPCETVRVIAFWPSRYGGPGDSDTVPGWLFVA